MAAFTDDVRSWVASLGIQPETDNTQGYIHVLGKCSIPRIYLDYHGFRSEFILPLYLFSEVIFIARALAMKEVLD